MLLTGQVFTANKNITLQKQQKCGVCREMTPCWVCIPIPQDILLRKTYKVWLRRRIQIIYKKSSFNQIILSPLLSPSFFQRSEKGFQESKRTVTARPGVGWDFRERSGLFSCLKWPSAPSCWWENTTRCQERRETDQISAFWIKWEARVVRSVQLAFLTARSLLFTGNQAGVKCSLCKSRSPAFPALFCSWSWRRRDSSSLAASRKID